MTAPGRSDIHAVVLAGGTGERLGRRSKADVELAGRRLLDVVLEGLTPVVLGTVVVVAPDCVQVPAGVRRTLEDPPLGGPLAGVGAGLEIVRRTAMGGPETGGGDPDQQLVVVCGVDTPGVGVLVPRLVEALSAHPGRDGAVIVGGEPEPLRQYLQAVYRIRALEKALRTVGRLRHRGVGRVLSVLDVVDVRATVEECRDLDTPADLEWWRDRLA